MALHGVIVHDEIESNDAYIEKESRTPKDNFKLSFYFLIVSFITVVLAIIGITAIIALLIGGWAYVWSEAPQDQRMDQLVDDIFVWTWRYARRPLVEIVLPIFSALFISFSALAIFRKLRDK